MAVKNPYENNPYNGYGREESRGEKEKKRRGSKAVSQECRIA